MRQVNSYEGDVRRELNALRAYQLRIAGWTLYEIADELGITPMLASQLLKRQLDELRALSAQEADSYRQYELSRLDVLLKALQGGIEAGEPAAIQAALKVIERRCKMLGIDAPVEMKIDDGGELREKLLALLG